MANRSSAWSRLVPSWPFLVGLAVFARLLIEKRALLNDPDTYLHIAAGRWILAHHALPLHDPFSHSMPGATWIAPEWLAEVVFAAVYDGYGWSAVVLLAIASVALSVGLLAHFLLRRLEPLPALIGAFAAAALLLPHSLARPHILALPLLVLWAGVLLGRRDAERSPPFRLLPVMVLWANLHGSFLVGLALAVFAAGEAVWQPRRDRSRVAEGTLWGGFVLASLAAACVTPHGITTMIQPLQLMRMPALQATFVEWLSPDFQKSPALEMWMLGIVLIGYASGMRLPWPRLALLLGLIHMTLQHSRHGDVLAIVAPLALAMPLAGTLATLAVDQPSPLLAWAGRLARPVTLQGALMSAVVLVALALPTVLRPIERGDDAVTPAAALAAATRLGLSGPVYNAEGFGGYLDFRGVPTFVDGRVELYGNDFIATAFAAETGDEAALTGILARYKIRWALLLPKSGAATVLDHLPGWERVYSDEWAVVYRRDAAKSG